jgi:hypothetical protein
MKCPECGKDYGAITPAHIKTHNMTTQEFREKYPDFTELTTHIYKKRVLTSTDKPYTTGRDW